MADQGPSIIPPFTKPVWPIRDQALLRSDESLQQPYLPHGNGDLKHARKRPTISHLFSFLCSHSNLTPMPVMSKLWWSERRVTNSSSCNSVALRSMAFCKRLHKCSCLEPLLHLVFLFCSLAGRFHLLLLTATSNIYIYIYRYIYIFIYIYIYIYIYVCVCVVGKGGPT